MEWRTKSMTTGPPEIHHESPVALYFGLPFNGVHSPEEEEKKKKKKKKKTLHVIFTLCLSSHLLLVPSSAFPSKTELH
ncbi:hypothetical protein NL676_023499 [Syzygium grande]|nr:hypothetical protein NL676_023499 [Syzygium grande]